VPSVTIDYGIDLGTINSEIVYFDGQEQILFTSADGKPYLPSAVWIPPDGPVQVGFQAHKRAGYDPLNAKIGFKRHMGMTTQYHFQEAGVRRLPEELAAEVLRSLVANVRRQSGEEVLNAVVTLPAMFEGPAAEATCRAAALAGIRYVHLLHDPIAAAMAYGMRTSPGDSSHHTWLVFDLGGSALDIALITLQGGRMTVVDHAGHNHLGGMDIDATILHSYVMPELSRNSKFAHLAVGNPACVREIALLREAVESAKIRLSREEQTTIRVENLLFGATGPDVELPLDRDSLSLYSRRILESALQICKRLLDRNGLTASQIEKMILVGGPTLSPVVRRTLQERLDIPLDTSIDPLSAVARGAALFASQHELPEAYRIPTPSTPPAEYHAVYSVSPIVHDDEAFFGATVTKADRTPPPSDFRLAVQRGESGSSTAETPFAGNDTVENVLRTDQYGVHSFSVRMSDLQGQTIPISPDSFVIRRQRITVDPPPLPRSIGVALKNNRVAWYIPKNTPLPASGGSIHQTAHTFFHREGGTLLTIPILEGDHPRADRNRTIGFIHIGSDAVHQDLPQGTEIKVSIKIDQNRHLQVEASIPALNTIQPSTVDHRSIILDAKRLREDFALQLRRIEELTADQGKTPVFLTRPPSADAGNDSRTALREMSRRLKEISDRDVQGDIDRVLVDLDDPESGMGKQADAMLRDLGAELDVIEELLVWPKLRARAHQIYGEARKAVASVGINEPTGAVELDQLAEILEEAQESQDREVMEAAILEMEHLTIRWKERDPEFLRMMIHEFSKSLHDGYSDRPLAVRHLQQATEALEHNHLSGVLEHLAALSNLLLRKTESITDLFDSDVL